MNLLTGSLAVVLAWVVGSLITEQTKASAPLIAAWLVRLAAARLPAELRAASEEQWLADLENTPGPLWKLATAIDCHRGVSCIVRDHLAEQSAARKRSDERPNFVAPPTRLLDAEVLASYQRARNYLAHIREPNSEEILREFEKLLNGETSTWSIEQRHALSDRVNRILNKPKR